MNNKDCIFCKIANNELNSYVIAENSKAIAFLDVNPISDGHTLVIPKNHYLDWSTTPTEDINAVISLSQFVAKILEKSKTIDAWGINYLSNQGQVAGQVINHFHIHVIPKYSKTEGFNIDCKNIYLTQKLPDLQKELIKISKKVLKDKYNK